MSGSCNWTGVGKKTEEKCDELIYMFWRVLFKVPDSTPKVGLIAETNTLRTKWRIWRQKLMLAIRLQNMDSSVLARQVYEKQVQLGLPGLAKEVKDICEKLSLPDINLCKIGKDKVEEYIYYNHYKDMKEKMDDSKKLAIFGMQFVHAKLDKQEKCY